MRGARYSGRLAEARAYLVISKRRESGSGRDHLGRGTGASAAALLLPSIDPGSYARACPAWGGERDRLDDLIRRSAAARAGFCLATTQ